MTGLVGGRPAGPVGDPGLTAAEAARRLASDGPNLLPGHAPKPAWSILASVVTEPMFLMLLAAGGVYLLLGDRSEASFLLSFVAVVLAITLLQERRTQRALEALRDLSAPRAQVIRDGRPQRVAGREVVRGDLLVLHEGDRVAADARLLHGLVAVDESLLSGESVAVEKRPAMDDAGVVYASTVVTRGVGLARVEAVGAATAVGRIGESLTRIVEPPSGLQRASRQLVRGLGITALLLSLGLVVIGWAWNGRPLLESLLSGIALAMAILPEEIPVVLTVFLALGAWRLSRQAVLTRRVSAVEALGAITVLAVDKTGTLTQNRMTVVELVSPAQRFDARAAAAPPEPLHLLVEFAMLATPPDPFDPMEVAIQAYGRRALAGTEHVHDDAAPEFEYPLSGEILAMTRVFRAGRAGAHLLATKGSPEAVLDLCHLDDVSRAAVRTELERMASHGQRVLGVARGQWSRPGGAGAADRWPSSQHDFQFEFLGLLGLEDPPRDDVADAVAQCRAAGVRVMMLTGDHPTTALAIAAQVGLGERPGVMLGTELESLGAGELGARLSRVDVCARLQPHHKLRLVESLRASGEVVAMTGDGVNDAPALRAADVGIAMGGRGTDVAREAAALVLLDDGFARIVAAIRQGRRIYDNIGRATRFVFAVHVPVIALALVPALLGWPALLLPAHIVLLELLIDPACSVVFEAEPEAPDVMRRPPRARDASPFARAALARGVTQGLGLATLLLLGHAALVRAGFDLAAARTAIFLALVADVLLLTLSNRAARVTVGTGQPAASPLIGRMGVAILVLLALMTGFPPLRNALALVPPGTAILGAAALLVVLGAAWLRGLAWLERPR